MANDPIKGAANPKTLAIIGAGTDGLGPEIGRVQFARVEPNHLENHDSLLTIET